MPPPRLSRGQEDDDAFSMAFPATRRMNAFRAALAVAAAIMALTTRH